MNNTIIAFDTNIWIYLAQEPALELVFSQIKDKAEKGDFTLIANNIILSEWKRNKKNTLSTANKNYKQLRDTMKQIACSITDASDKSLFKKIVDCYFKTSISEDAVKRKVDDVEDFLTKCGCVETSDEQKIHIANLAINNLPPLDHGKNNFNDALIVRNLCHYVSTFVATEGLDDHDFHFIYVSNNPKDFIDSETGEIYRDILKDIDLNFKIVNIKTLPEALQLSENLSKIYNDWIEETIDSLALDHAYMEWEISRGK